ncbi:MAG: MauE/DoxX family redox-associated membrane protein [Candidatus Neomarinimicrobiota bacterium]
MNIATGIHHRIRSWPPFPPWMKWPVFVSRVALGIIFIISGTLKVLDAQSFMANLPFYNIPAWLIPFGALIPPIELTMGLAFLTGMTPRFTSLAAAAMLLLFSLLLIAGIAGGELSDCGCFGQALEQSPQSALLRNLLLMLLAGVIWYYHRGSRTSWRPWQAGLGAAILLVLGTVTGYTIHTPKLDPSLAKAGEFFPDEGFGRLAPELTGKQLVYVFTADSPDCWNSVANVKALAGDSTYVVFGLTDSDPHQIGWFANEFDINFKVYTYNPKLFNTTFRTWPALYYLDDGLIIGKVENEIPAPRTLQEVYMAKWQ